MTQVEKLLYEIERRGNAITTHDLMTLGIMQYQTRLKELREKLALTGRILTEGIPVTGQKRCFIYKIVDPRPTQLDMFGSAA